MKRHTLYIVLVLAGLFFFAGMDASAQMKMKKEPVFLAAEEIKWEPLQGATPGVMNAKLWGDPSKGAYGGLTKFPAGFKTPLHYHTNDIKIVIIKGAYVYNDKPYTAGSYVFIPGGVKHTSAGAEDSETIFFIEQPGKFDLKPIEPAKKKN